MHKLTKEMLNKNNNRSKAISDENQEIYTNMVVYLRGSNLTEYNQEIVREDLIELILDGQQRGDNIQKVMGGSYKGICDGIIEAMPNKTKKERIMEFIGTSLNGLWILGVIAVIKNLVVSLMLKASEFNFILSIGDIIATILIIILANGVVWFITKTALNEKQTNKIVSFLKTWVVFCCVFSAILLPIIYFDTAVLNIPLIIAVIIALLIFITSKIINSRVY
jgi:DNA-binding ferritin-like protein (Dps family)